PSLRSRRGVTVNDPPSRSFLSPFPASRRRAVEPVGPVDAVTFAKPITGAGPSPPAGFGVCPAPPRKGEAVPMKRTSAAALAPALAVPAWAQQPAARPDVMTITGPDGKAHACQVVRTYQHPGGGTAHEV